MAIRDKALTDSVALVTGASRGIGRACAVALGRRGATVIVNYANREDAARETAELVEKEGGVAVTAAFDVSQQDQVNAKIKELTAELGGLHILVNNAGVAKNGLLLRYSDADWQASLDINLAGAFFCARAAAKSLLKAKERGRIINISSVVGEMGNAGQAAYAATKAGLLGLTKALARELAPRGVCVNAVAPGFIETDMTAEHLPQEQRALLLSQIPLARIGRAAEVADMVAFLAGPEASYITGQVVRVNGGMLM